MGYLCIKNLNCNNIQISHNQKNLYNLKYNTPHVTLYGITFQIDYIGYVIKGDFIYIQINHKNYQKIQGINIYLESKLNNYKSFTYESNGSYFLKLYQNERIIMNIKNGSFYLWISKIKCKNYINYPIIYIL